MRTPVARWRTAHQLRGSHRSPSWPRVRSRDAGERAAFVRQLATCPGRSRAAGRGWDGVLGVRRTDRWVRVVAGLRRLIVGSAARCDAASVCWFVPVVVDGRSSSEFGEFEEVVAEYAMAAPDADTGVAAQSGAAPRPIPFQVGDAALASSAPFHEVDEGVGVFDSGSCLRGFPGAGDHDGGDADGGEIGFDAGVPVASIGGHGGGGAELVDDPFDGGADQVGVRRVPDVDGMVDDDPGGGVGYLA
jgi:hypothetical protein